MCMLQNTHLSSLSGFVNGMHFKRAARDAQLDPLMDEGMRDAVVIVLEFHVVIDVDRGFLPLGNDLGRYL